MKTNDTFILLKPVEAETLFITKDRDIALDILESSTPESLSWCELELNDEAEAVIALDLDGWLDLSQWKFPYKRKADGFEYDNLTPDEFVVILRDYPNAISKLIELSDLRKYPVLMEEYPLLAAERLREVYEIFQKFPLKEDK
ncbi:hypothetical protein P3553_10435 [Vibrio parahaemolyticus]|uniref:hypothetical protein n=1 Tax=Vibrio parahaemolyticus TaxID=670 RepID=UPI001A8DCBE1|nr:hypothetical protein [Vibrio parahaemolyticus]MBO0167112.1 hypothetical protein [Vibrio parahaemolyticus]MDF4752516.1 hypothetical protein [Vibrio parahaemolyticus]MDF4778630.1 hypothetical protein [Vibrio parahaemolyticus]MDF4786601.1 hypothetical protein [Vibrio parahaemolyticus]MDF4794473.1 hypothetical protein [Vibrio parahaemolyticus]